LSVASRSSSRIRRDDAEVRGPHYPSTHARAVGRRYAWSSGDGATYRREASSDRYVNSPRRKRSTSLICAGCFGWPALAEAHGSHPERPAGGGACRTL